MSHDAFDSGTIPSGEAAWNHPPPSPMDVGSSHRRDDQLPGSIPDTMDGKYPSPVWDPFWGDPEYQLGDP
jgi:hypothetical protein